MSIKPTPLKDTTIDVYDNLYDNLYDDKIINFYNDFLNVLQANENHNIEETSINLNQKN